MVLAFRQMNMIISGMSLSLCSQCGDHFGELEPTFPRMYVWLLGLFSFMLGVEDAKLHGAVVQVEQGLLRKTGHKETPENLDE